MKASALEGNPSAVYLGLLTGVTAVSFAAVLIRLADAPALVVAASRMTLAAVIISPAALIYSRSSFVRLTRRERLLTGGSATCLALHFAFWIASLSYTSVASSVILVSTDSIMIALVSHFMMKEPVSPQAASGIAVAFIGMVILGWGDFRVGSRELLGDGLAMLGAAAAAGYLIVGRQVRGQVPLLPYITVVYAGAAVLLLASVLAAGDTFVGYSTNTYVMLALVALIPQVVGHSSLNWALRYITASLVAVSKMAEPIGATLLALLILQETPSMTGVLGGAFILGGVYLALRRSTTQVMD